MIVYSVTNKSNNKKYFCATIYDGLEKARYYHTAKTKEYKRRHKLNPNKRVSTAPFHKAYIKYGERNFRFKVEGKFDNKTDLYKHKEFLISKYKTMNPKFGYNCTTGGNKTFKNSPETNERQSIAFTGKKMPDSYVKLMKARVGELHPHFGIKRSKQALENIRQGQLNSDYVKTDEHKKKTSETMKKRWQEPEIIAKMKKRKLRDVSGKNNPMYGKGFKGKDNPMYGKKAWNRGIPTPQWQKDIISKKNKEHHKIKKAKLLKEYSERTEKKCYKCEEVKNLNMFYKSKAHLDGYAGLCKLCEKKRKQKRGKSNG